MKSQDEPLPLSTAALAFGALSVPLAFAGHLCSLALVLGLYAAGLGYWGQRRAARHLLRYSPTSVRRARLASRLGLAGASLALLMWILWASGVLLG
ncbi:MAG: hypothetical protein ACK4L7_09570 [Flavobacteriales bacterium]